MPELKITGIIPCFNHEKWINQAIDSMMNQTRPPDLIVVVDDGSTDKSFEKVLERIYKPKNDKEKIEGKILHTNQRIILTKLGQNYGPSISRNVAMKFTWNETDLFAFLDSDDLYENTKIEKSMNQFDEGTGAVYSDFTTWNEETGLKIKQFKPAFTRNLLLQECIVNNDSLVAKKALEICGLYWEVIRSCEDYDLWLRISEKFIIKHIPEQLVTIRIGNHSQSTQQSKQRWEENYRKVFQRMQARATQ